MNAVTHPVLRLGRNTEQQAQELSRRAVVLMHGRNNTFFTFSIVDADVAREQADELDLGGLPVSVNGLHAPNGLYKRLVTGQRNVVAVHRRVDDGRLRVYGPFSREADAYDHFGDDESPHDTVVTVMSVFADMRAPADRKPSL